jgi:hypothetical protein
MNNTEIVKTGMKAWESSDVPTMTELVADDFVLSGPTPQPLGKQEHGDSVIAKAHITCTHTGVLALPGMPPIPATGKKVALPEEVQTYTVKNGKLTSLSTDARPDAGIPGMLAQLGFPIPQG